jgi:hypothetical protein
LTLLPAPDSGSMERDWERMSYSFDKTLKGLTARPVIGSERETATGAVMR